MINKVYEFPPNSSISSISANYFLQKNNFEKRKFTQPASPIHQTSNVQSSSSKATQEISDQSQIFNAPNKPKKSYLSTKQNKKLSIFYSQKEENKHISQYLQRQSKAHEKNDNNKTLNYAIDIYENNAVKSTVKQKYQYFEQNNQNKFKPVFEYLFQKHVQQSLASPSQKKSKENQSDTISKASTIRYLDKYLKRRPTQIKYRERKSTIIMDLKVKRHSRQSQVHRDAMGQPIKQIKVVINNVEKQSISDQQMNEQTYYSIVEPFQSFSI